MKWAILFSILVIYRRFLVVFSIYHHRRRIDDTASHPALDVDAVVRLTASDNHALAAFQA